MLTRGASRVVLVRVDSNRAGDPKALARSFTASGTGKELDVASTLGEGLAKLADDDLVLVTGSMYLMGEALEWLGEGTGNERRLNDWSPRR